MFDPRLESLENTYKYYEGKPASSFIAAKDQQDWMEQRKMAEGHNENKRQRNLIRDIFVAIDEDGNGTMEIDELIKALLSLCLS